MGRTGPSANRLVPYEGALRRAVRQRRYRAALIGRSRRPWRPLFARARTRLWATLPGRPQSALPFPRARPPRDRRDAPPRGGQRGADRGGPDGSIRTKTKAGTLICKDYNKGSCSFGKQCYNAHVCNLCGSNAHSAAESRLAGGCSRTAKPTKNKKSKQRQHPQRASG